MEYLAIGGVGLLRVVQANFNKQASRHLQSSGMYLYFGFFFEFMAAVCSFLYLCIGGFSGFGTETVICAAITGFCFVAELLTALFVMRHAPLVLSNLCALSGGLIVPLIAAIFWFDEPMQWWQWCGVAVFFVAVMFLTTKQSTEKKSLSLKAAVMLALNFLINGCCGTVGKYFAIRVENNNPAMFSCFCYGFASIFFLITIAVLQTGKRITPSSFKRALPKKLYLFGVILGLGCASIVYSSTILARTVPVVILNTLPSIISIVGCLIVGQLLFKEKITPKNVLGVLFGISSAVLLVYR